jgi:hypothetical protein
VKMATPARAIRREGVLRAGAHLGVGFSPMAIARRGERRISAIADDAGLAGFMCDPLDLAAGPMAGKGICMMLDMR